VAVEARAELPRAAAAERRRLLRRKRRKTAGWKALLYVVLIAGAILSIAPFAWMVTSSFQPLAEMFSVPPHWIPRNFTLDNYHDFFFDPKRRAEGVGRWFFNSMIVAGGVTLLQLFFGSLAAYTFAKRRFPFRNLLFLLGLGTLMIPGQVLIIPQYIILKNMPLFGGNNIWGQGGHGWLDSYWGLIIPHSVSMFSIFLLMQYMRTIPDELLDAARVDGAGEFRIYAQIVLPLSRPALAAVGIFTFTFFWDDFFWPLIIISNPDLYTLPLGLALFVVKHRTVWDLLMAGSVVATVPVILMFLFFQRNFVRGISVTGIKG
jgi:multiple sugar transport system permease protein